ncbi:MAG: S-layer homology domain-containing protein [Clostridia bacterium]|nr:S-layer homology domain-containing protein [Clostridia bacterium]
MKLMKKAISVILALCLLAALALNCFAAASEDLFTKTANLLLASCSDPQYGSVGGEWAVLGLVRSETALPASCLDKYTASVEAAVKNSSGVLSKRKYTDYSRTILGLTAAGKDPTSVAGYDLLMPLADFDQTVLQGTNGAVFALLAFDCGQYEIPVNPDAKTQATRQKYVDYLLSREVDGGGWAIGTTMAEVDITAMVLQALAKYRQQTAVEAAIDRGLIWLSSQQTASGGFESMHQETCESVSQVIIALCELGISPSDSRFVKNGHTAPDNLSSFFVPGEGFCHTADGKADHIATEQAFLALTALHRMNAGQSSLYRISDGSSAVFSDISGHRNQTAIEALAEKGIINGMGNGTFAPNKTMTRAEFSAIVVRGIGLTREKAAAFSDVSDAKWYADYIGAAYRAGIVNGVGNGKFNPEGTITRQEAAAMIARSAKSLGLDTSSSDTDAVLSAFSDGADVSSWARASMAYCCDAGLLEKEASISPQKPILRCEIAQILYNLLILAEKL